MSEEITTMRDADRAIQDLIDSFSDAIFIEACEAMESSAEVSRQARQEELEDA